MIVTARRATEADALDLAPRVRDADRRELWDGWGCGPEDGLMRSLRLSTCAWSGCVDGRVFVMWGAGPVSAVTCEGMAWLIASPEIERLAVPFLRRNRDYVRRMFLDYEVLTNHVDVRNRFSRRWLEWLGAEFDTPAPFGWAGRPFMRFTMRPEHV